MLGTLKRRLDDYLWSARPQLALRMRSIQNHHIYEDAEFLAFYRRLFSGGRVIMTVREVYNLWTYARAAQQVEGDYAEVGVYRGAGARVIREAAPGRTLHLFDTFGGMPETDASVDVHQAGDFADTSLEDVKRFVGTEGVHYYKGLFPASAAPIAGDARRFAFVHLDVDIYQSTLDGLRFFYPRLTPGGILLSHDYSARSCPGVKRAFTEFFADKPEPVLPVWETHALIVKAPTSGTPI